MCQREAACEESMLIIGQNAVKRRSKRKDKGNPECCRKQWWDVDSNDWAPCNDRDRQTVEHLPKLVAVQVHQAEGRRKVTIDAELPTASGRKGDGSTIPDETWGEDSSQSQPREREE